MVSILPLCATQVIDYEFRFDTALSLNAWLVNPWGGQGANSVWDATQDHTGNGGGSLHVFDVWQDGDQLVNLGWWGGSPWFANKPIDLTTYQTVSFWMKWDSADSTADLSVFQATGETLQLWAVPADNSSWINLGPVTIPDAASNGWVKISVPINLALPGLSTAQGLGLKKFTGTGLTNTFAFWADDFALEKQAEMLVPIMQIARPVAGLNLFAVNGPYNRESIRTIAGQSWIGHGANPVTYAFTLKQGVDGSGGAQFQNHIFLVSNPGPETSPDWNETNVIFLDLESASNGGTTWIFRYKTNLVSGNSMFYDTNVIPAQIADTNIIGTWSVTFLNDTNVTMTTPGGSSTNFNLPTWLPSLFPDTVYAYFGVQANNSVALGMRSIYKEIQINGTDNPLSDEFEADVALNSNLWTVVAADPQGIIQVPPTAAFWVSWTLPDIGYTLVCGPSLSNPPVSWDSPAGVTPVLIDSRRRALIPQSSLPAGPAGYFALVRRNYTQLQVLLPGETNAPNTISGKIGTPTPVSLSAGGTIVVMVNAVDPYFHIINTSGEIISLSSSDSTATLPAPATLVAGSLSQSIAFGTNGTYTVSATDVGNSLQATSSPVQVLP